MKDRILIHTDRTKIYIPFVLIGFVFLVIKLAISELYSLNVYFKVFTVLLTVASLVIIILLLLVIVQKFFTAKALIEIEKTGINNRSLFFLNSQIPWNTIKEIEVDLQSESLLLIHLNNENSVKRTGLNLFQTGKKNLVHISTYLTTVRPSELKNIIQDYRQNQAV